MSINKILTDKDRQLLAPLIGEMWETCPQMMSRKIPEANVQQAFILDHVYGLFKYNNQIEVLSVGCFEDTVFEFLKKKGYMVAGIDPVYGYDLHKFRQNHGVLFDNVFATSVIEHVEKDEEFIADLCNSLKPRGWGFLTTDFKDDYKIGDPLPATDVRFYTRYDLEVRLPKILKEYDCELVDEPDWTDKDNFVYQGHDYSFATFVFRKNIDV